MTRKIKRIESRPRERGVITEQYKRLSETILRLTDKDGNEYFCARELVRKIKIDGVERLILIGTNGSLLPRKTAVYDSFIAENICERIMNGETILAMAKEPDMPSASVIYKWARNNPEFAENLDLAMRFCAYTAADKVQESAESEEIITDTDIKKAQMQMSAYKWRAERFNPDRFGPSTKVKNEGGPEIILVNTGINRETIETSAGKDLIENKEKLD